MSKYLIKKQNGTISILTMLSDGDIAQEIKKLPAEGSDAVVSYRELQDSDFPESREFRDAWCDVTSSSSIDIDLCKAKDVQLKNLRLCRDKKLSDSDSDMTRALESGNSAQIESLKAYRASLRNATEQLKALVVSGHNDQAVLSSIRDAGTLKV